MSEMDYLKFFRTDTPAPITTWSPATLTADSVRSAIQKIRDAPYPTPCGAPGNPHIFHPLEHPRLMSWQDWEALDTAKWDVPFAICANMCGQVFPLWPASRVDDRLLYNAVDTPRESC